MTMASNALGTPPDPDDEIPIVELTAHLADRVVDPGGLERPDQQAICSSASRSTAFNSFPTYSPVDWIGTSSCRSRIGTQS